MRHRHFLLIPFEITSWLRYWKLLNLRLATRRYDFRQDA